MFITFFLDYRIYFISLHREIFRLTIMDALNLSPYIIAKSNLAGDGITNKKLQKLLYYVKAWGLVYFEDGVIDDMFEAWVHGPVCPVVYQAYKNYGFGLIDEGMSEEKTMAFVTDFRSRQDAKGLSDKMDLVDAVFDKYGQITSLQLELLTHQEDPWIEARQGLSPIENGSRVISEESMKKYYGKAL